MDMAIMLFPHHLSLSLITLTNRILIKLTYTRILNFVIAFCSIHKTPKTVFSGFYNHSYTKQPIVISWRTAARAVRP